MVLFLFCVSKVSSVNMLQVNNGKAESLLVSIGGELVKAECYCVCYRSYLFHNIWGNCIAGDSHNRFTIIMQFEWTFLYHKRAL